MGNQTRGIEEINDMLKSIEPMIFSILRKYKNISMDDMEDFKQEIMMFLWNKVIPAYKSDLSTKFSSFAYRCIVNFVNRKIHVRDRNYHYEKNASHSFYDIQTERCSEHVRLSRTKIQIFEKMIKQNEIILKPKEKKVIQMILNSPDITQREIADKLGYKHASAISMMILRLRRRLEKVKALKVSEPDDFVSI